MFTIVVGSWGLSMRRSGARSGHAARPWCFTAPCHQLLSLQLRSRPFCSHLAVIEMLPRERSKRARTLTAGQQASLQTSQQRLGNQADQPRPAAATGAAEPEGGEDEGSSVEKSTFMAVSCWGSRIGVAYYDPALRELLCTEAVDETDGPFPHQVLQLAKLHAQPAVIYASARADEGLLAALRAPLATAVGGGAGAGASPNNSAGGGGGRGGSDANGSELEQGVAGSYEVRLERSSLFAPAAARTALESAQVRGLTPPGASGRERLHALNARVSLAREQQVCAAGALLALLARDGLLLGAAPTLAGEAETVAEAAAAGGSSLLCLNDISEFDLDGFLTVDPASMEALQIFCSESHPSAMGIGQPKEGFSIFSLLCRCVSPPGRRLLRLWFARPVINLQVLDERLDAVDFFLHTPDALAALRSGLRSVKDAPRLLARLRSSQTAPVPKDFQALAAALAGALTLRGMLVQLAPAEAAEGGRLQGCSPPCAWQQGQEQEQQQQAWQQEQGGEHSPAGMMAGRGQLHRQQQHWRQQHQGWGMGAHPSTAAATCSWPVHEEVQRQLVNEAAGSSSAGLPAVLFKAVEGISEELVACHSLLASVLDPGQELDGMMVAEGVSQELDQLKALYFGLPDLLGRVVAAEQRRVPRELCAALRHAAWACCYLPQVGFVMRLEGGRLPPHLEEHLPDWAFAFDSSGDAGMAGEGEVEQGCYYHTDYTRQLTQRYGDVQHRIRDMELGILSQLVQRLDEFAPALGRAWRALAELDCLLSLAGAARDLNLTRPVLTREPELLIEGGRHLLAEQLVEGGLFIPNDTQMRTSSGRLQVVTGPNYSGKSVYAKQVALITFLAHVGSFVPAQSARVGLTDRIFTRVLSREAAGGLVGGQSTFMVDLTQVAVMLRLATERSLCILDEFGKGTLASDGVGLLCAALRHFSSRPHPPRLVLCTHFSEVLSPAHLPRSPHLSFLTMSVVAEEGPKQQQRQQEGTPGQQQQCQPAASAAAGVSDAQALAAQLAVSHGLQVHQLQQLQQQQQLVFLYRLVPGRAAPSFGLHCARLAGVQESVLTRAAQVIECQLAGKAVSAAPPPALAARTARCTALARQLAGLSLRDTAAVGALLRGALELAGAAPEAEAAGGAEG